MKRNLTVRECSAKPMKISGSAAVLPKNTRISIMQYSRFFNKKLLTNNISMV